MFQAYRTSSLGPVSMFSSNDCTKSVTTVITREKIDPNAINPTFSTARGSEGARMSKILLHGLLWTWCSSVLLIIGASMVFSSVENTASSSSSVYGCENCAIPKICGKFCHPKHTNTNTQHHRQRGGLLEHCCIHIGKWGIIAYRLKQMRRCSENCLVTLMQRDQIRLLFRGITGRH